MDIKNQPSNIFDDTMRLSPERKHKIRTRLIEEMQTFPYRPQLAIALQTMFRIKSKPFEYSRSRRVHRLVALIAVLTLFLTSAGVTFAAEQALPGDTLYPVKVNITEEFQTRLKFTPEARARWDERRAERRLNEAARLASSGRLNLVSGAELHRHFARHITAINQAVERFEDQDEMQTAVELSSTLSAILETQNRVLGRLSEEKPGARLPLEMLATGVQNNSAIFAGKRQRLEEKMKEISAPNLKPSIEKIERLKIVSNLRRQSALQGINDLRQTLDLHRTALGSEFISAVEQKIAETEQLRVDAETRFAEGKYNEAFQLANQADFINRKIKLLIEARVAFQINIGLPSFISPKTASEKVKSRVNKEERRKSRAKVLKNDSRKTLEQERQQPEKDGERESIDFPFMTGTITD